MEWSQELSEALPNSRLLVWEGFGHTACITTSCVAEIAGNYLVTQRLPHVGATCPPSRLNDLPEGASQRVVEISRITDSSFGVRATPG